jgi:hypothetical protein
VILPDTDGTYSIGTQWITLTTPQHDKQKAEQWITLNIPQHDKQKAEQWITLTIPQHDKQKFEQWITLTIPQHDKQKAEHGNNSFNIVHRQSDTSDRNVLRISGYKYEHRSAPSGNKKIT